MFAHESSVCMFGPGYDIKQVISEETRGRIFDHSVSTSLKGLFQIYIFKNPTLMTLYKGSFEGDAQRMINISSLKALWRTPFILSLREINKELWSRDTEALLLLILPFSL